MSENFNECVAIVDGAMRVVEQPDVGQEVTEPGAAEAVLAPVDLGLGAGPVLMFKSRRQPLGEFSIEAGVMGDDDVGLGDEGFQHGDIDPVPGDHVVRDAGQVGDQCGDRDRRLIVGLEDAADPGDFIRFRIAEFDHGHFDDLVLGRVEARRLKVEDDADLSGIAGRCRRRASRDQAAKDFIVAGGL